MSRSFTSLLRRFHISKIYGWRHYLYSNGELRFGTLNEEDQSSLIRFYNNTCVLCVLTPSVKGTLDRNVFISRIHVTILPGTGVIQLCCWLGWLVVLISSIYNMYIIMGCVCEIISSPIKVWKILSLKDDSFEIQIMFQVYFAKSVYPVSDRQKHLSTP